MSDAEQLAAMDFMATTFLGIYFGTLVIQAIFTGMYFFCISAVLDADFSSRYIHTPFMSHASGGW